jgi:hypothetical protein
MGGWIGGQADYVMVPYADFNLLKFPDKAQAMEKIRDLTCLTDILPTGFHGAVTAKVGVGSTVYVAGAGPVGLAAAAAAQILGAAAVLIGDMNKERLAHAKSVGFEPIDLTRHDRLGELVADVLGTAEVDCAIDCVGFEAKAPGTDGKVVEAPAVVLNSLRAPSWRWRIRTQLTHVPLLLTHADAADLVHAHATGLEWASQPFRHAKRCLIRHFDTTWTRSLAASAPPDIARWSGKVARSGLRQTVGPCYPEASAEHPPFQGLALATPGPAMTRDRSAAHTRSARAE